MGKASRTRRKKMPEGSRLEVGQSSASGALPSEIPPQSQPFRVPVPVEITGGTLVNMMESVVRTQELVEDIRQRQNKGDRFLWDLEGRMQELIEEEITRRMPGTIDAVVKVVFESFRAAMDEAVDEISKARVADATRIKNLSDDLDGLKSKVAQQFEKLDSEYLRELRARIEAIEGDSNGMKTSVIKNLEEELAKAKTEINPKVVDLQSRVEKLEGDTKAEIQNLGEEVEKVKNGIQKIPELRAQMEDLAKESEQVPERIRRHISEAVPFQCQNFASMQASAFAAEFGNSGLGLVQAAMCDFLQSSLLPSLKKSLEDTIERQIVRGIATIARQHSEFEVSLSQKLQSYVDAAWTATNELKSLLADFPRDLSFRMPNSEEEFSSGAKDQEHNSIGEVLDSSSRREQL